MGSIRQLPPSVVNQIAAGEVVERPCSVVKELLENAIDARASRIDLSVERGGKDLVRVADNGIGIAPDDLGLAFQPHATSKLVEAEDLYRVRTLGFRGEALAAIAEISKVRCQTRRAEANEGAELCIEGGEFGPIKSAGCPIGTVIEVRNLFYNVPVRRAFLKSDSTEAGHVVEMFTRIALANPETHLTYRSGGKIVHDLPPVAGMRDRIAVFFGRELAESLLWVEGRLENMRLWGHVAHPSQSRSTSKGQYLFLGGRYVRDRSLGHALNEAYRGLLMVGRMPVAFLHIELPPEEVDVNVHPTKVEVRFRDSNRVYSHLLATLRQTFLKSDLHARLQPAPASAQGPGPFAGATAHGPARGGVGQDVARLSTAPDAPREASAWSLSSRPQSPRFEPLDTAATGSPLDRLDLTGGPADRQKVASWFEPSKPRPMASIPESVGQPPPREWAQSLPPTFSVGPGDTFDEFDGAGAAGTGSPIRGPGASAPPAEDARFASKSEPMPEATAKAPSAGPAPPSVWDLPLKAIQVHDSYLIAETSDGVVVIDQHALHERILYEELRERAARGNIESQRLLVPEPVDLSADEAAAVLEQGPLLAELGLEVEAFGGGTVLVRSLPAMLPHIVPERLVRDLAEHLRSQALPPTRDGLLAELLHMMACKAAIKAGQPLTPPEIRALLERRQLVADSHHCPHGRPTALVFTRAELEKQFGRI